jgi:hypothetical protein
MPMTRAHLLAAALAARACGTDQATPPAPRTPLHVVEYDAPAELVGYVLEFERAWGRPVTVPTMVVQPQEIDSADGSENAVGVCRMTDQGPVVLIDSDYWHNATSTERWALVWHELGHCELGRPHLDDMIEVRGMLCPKSVMRFAVSGTALCVANGIRTSLDYANELFSAEAAVTGTFSAQPGVGE